MHPVSCFGHTVEVFILHLRVILAIPLMVLCVIVATLPSVDELDWLAPLSPVVLCKGVCPDVIVALKGKQLHVDCPSVLAFLFDEIGLQ